MSNVWRLMLQIAIVAFSVVLGSFIAENHSFIPKSLLELPPISFSNADILTNVKVFLVFCGGAFLIGRLVLGWEVFKNARRTAMEIYVLLVGIVASSLYLFVYTTVNFSPELLLDASVICVILFAVSYLVLGASEKPSVFGRLWGLIANLFSMLKKPAVWAVLVFAMSPLLLVAKFLSDRDFANWITEKRISANISNDFPYQLQPILSEATFLQPIMVQFAPGDDDTIYVLERSGSIFRLDYPSGANKTLLIDQTQTVGYVEMENGALGFDFHPDFAANGEANQPYLYMYYTSYLQDSQVNYLSRFDMSLPDPIARKENELVLIEQNRSTDGYHNAGSVEFGPDGFMYVSVGEASMVDCHQKLDCALVGGILRLDVDKTGGDVSHPITRQTKGGKSAHYYIPNDNPYVGQPDVLEEFWAHGLRNPFRISFDQKTGNLWAGDVGSTVWEEVNLIVKGGNYQYPYIEGAVETPGESRPETLMGEERGPIFTYPHTALLRAVIGGVVYYGEDFPELQGQYIFGDNYSGEIFSMPSTGETVESVKPLARSPLVAQAGITSLVNGPSNEILVTALGGLNSPTGLVFKLVGPDVDVSSAALDLATTKSETVDLAQAKSLYNVNCARCHGATGMADGPDSKHLGAWVPNFQSAEFHQWRSEDEILMAIRKGGASVGQSPAMPAWESILSEPEMIAIKDYVLSLKPE